MGNVTKIAKIFFTDLGKDIEYIDLYRNAIEPSELLVSGVYAPNYPNGYFITFEQEQTASFILADKTGYCGGSFQITLSSIIDCNLDFEATEFYPPAPTPSPSPSTIYYPLDGWSDNELVVSVTPTITPTRTVSVTPSITVSPSATPSATPSISITPTVSPSISITPTVTPSISITPTITPTISITPTASPVQQAVIGFATDSFSFDYMACTNASNRDTMYSNAAPSLDLLQVGDLVYEDDFGNVTFGTGWRGVSPNNATPVYRMRFLDGVVQEIVACPAPSPTISVTPSISPTPTVTPSTSTNYYPLDGWSTGSL